MKPPIVADYRGDVVVFDSVDEAERYIEAPDARSGACVVFDGEGSVLRAVVVKRFLAERVKLERSPNEESRRDELRQILIRFLSDAGGSRDERRLDDMALDELLAETVRTSRKSS